MIKSLVSRNYIEFWSSKINNGGNFANSVLKGSLAECETQTELILQTFPSAFAVWKNQKGYLLIDKANLIGVLTVLNAHYSSFFASTWGFFQDGFVAKVSPRETWSNGE
jgi:hypothetical protein